MGERGPAIVGPSDRRRERGMMATTRQPVSMDRLIAIQDVAEILGVNVRHVRRLVQERRIPFIKWGHLLRFDPVVIASWIDEHRQIPFEARY